MPHIDIVEDDDFNFLLDDNIMSVGYWLGQSKHFHTISTGTSIQSSSSFVIYV